MPPQKKTIFFSLYLLLSGTILALGGWTPKWFSKGESVVNIGIPSHKVADLQKSCIECHQGIHREWQNSAHALSWTHPIFQEGFQMEPKDRCVRCHAPLAEQFQAYEENRRNDYLLSTGINCVACHVRDGQVVSNQRTSKAPHPVLVDSDFGTPKFCAGCHEFRTHPFGDHPPTPAQTTFTEWNEYQKNGGKKSCTECHSSPFGHGFPGPITAKTSGLDFSYSLKGNNIEFLITNSSAGHSIPTGDMLREIVLEISTGDDFRPIKKWGKVYAKVADPNGHKNLQLSEDTRIKSGDTSKVSYSLCDSKKRKLQYRLMYYRSPLSVRKVSEHPPEMWSRELFKGEIKTRLKSCKRPTAS